MAMTDVALAVVDSEFLFRVLNQHLDVLLICDVGSFDGAHALRFVRDGVKIEALEANPRNAETLAQNPDVAAAGISVHHLAAWKETRSLTFNVVNVGTGRDDDWQNKIGSLLDRSDYSFETEQVEVAAIRLDEFVTKEHPGDDRVALWIDVEGVGYEVIQGIAGIRSRVVVVHIEVETVAHWHGQRLWPDIRAQMQQLGFRAIGRGPGKTQCDVVLLPGVY